MRAISFEQTFTITLTDVADNAKPSSLTLNSTSVAENAAADTVIGTVTGTDPERGTRSPTRCSTMPADGSCSRATSWW